MGIRAGTARRLLESHALRAQRVLSVKDGTTHTKLVGESLRDDRPTTELVRHE
jgi:hypothetical protein